MYPKKKGQEMRQKIVREGNAFYEIDDECMRKKEEQKKKKGGRKTGKSPAKYHAGKNKVLRKPDLA